MRSRMQEDDTNEAEVEDELEDEVEDDVDDEVEDEVEDEERGRVPPRRHHIEVE